MVTPNLETGGGSIAAPPGAALVPASGVGTTVPLSESVHPDHPHTTPVEPPASVRRARDASGAFRGALAKGRKTRARLRAHKRGSLRIAHEAERPENSIHRR